MTEKQQFRSALSVPIEGYITEKRAVGYKFKKGANLLKSFDSFVYSRCLEDINLTKQLVLEWTARKPNETTSTQCGRISLFNKERVLPMADSLTERCRNYRRNVDMGKMGNPYFFPSPFGGHYSESTIFDFIQKANCWGNTCRAVWLARL